MQKQHICSLTKKSTNTNKQIVRQTIKQNKHTGHITGWNYRQEKIYLITYSKNQEIEKGISKMKNIAKIRMTDEYDEDIRCLSAGKEKYKFLKEAFPSEVNQLEPGM